MAITKPEAEAISLKTSLTQLGIWLNQNKQKNVPNITMAGSPVAAKAGIMDLVFAFATQYALAVVGVAQAPVKELQVSFSSIFDGIKNLISDKIDFIKDLIVAGNPAETSASEFVKATPPYYDISPGADYDTIVLTYPAIATSAEPLKQAMLNVQAYATEMYTASGLEKISISTASSRFCSAARLRARSIPIRRAATTKNERGCRMDFRVWG